MKLLEENKRKAPSSFRGGASGNLSANAEDLGDAGSIPVQKDPLKEENGSPFQYSCLENPMDRGA